MSKKQIIILDKWELKHRENLKKIEKQLERIFEETAKEAAKVIISLHNYDPERPFTVRAYPTVKKKIETITSTLNDRVANLLDKGINQGWELANGKNDELVTDTYHVTPSAVMVLGYAVTSTHKTKQVSKVAKYCDSVKDMTAANTSRSIRVKTYLGKLFQHNDTARAAFKTRTQNGLSLSKRVWNLGKQNQALIEMGIDIALREGKSAIDTANDLKQYLKHPDTLFRKVRDEYGALRLTGDAKLLHPGQGVYRSAFQNALRMVGTEINIAYRTADFERMQQLDFIVGQEVKLSNNHTLNGKPFTDMCDALAGRYPKDFKFTIWHPRCRCYCTKILKTDEEMDFDDDLILSGRELSNSKPSKNAILDTPSNYKKWVKDNEERIKKAKSMPYFLKDNEAYMKAALNM